MLQKDISRSHAWEQIDKIEPRD